MTQPEPTVIPEKDELEIKRLAKETVKDSHRETSPVRSQYFEPREPRMQTRARTKKSPVPFKPVTKFSKTGALGSPWKKPLVYPRTGKRRAEVVFHDLERLDDEEFLNDNIVGLYLRFLENMIELKDPHLASKIYFFNSYFFDSLTKTTNGRKGINYDAVKKWTRNENILSKEFVIVPINESSHWYLAVIVNLDKLKRGGALDLTSENGIEEDAEKAEVKEAIDLDAEIEFAEVKEKNGDSPGLSQGVKAIDLDGESPEESKKIETADQESIQAVDTTDDKDIVVEQLPTPANGEDEKAEAVVPSRPVKSKASPRRPMKRTPSVRRYEPDQTMIITFDSLGIARSPTIRILREYIREEALHKASMTIDPAEIQGMTAKQIPEQANYSDCGLYLLAYVEKLVQNPQEFVRLVLQKEMNKETYWPHLTSSELRKRLRAFILRLHLQQESCARDAKEDKFEKHDHRHISILLGEARSVTVEERASIAEKRLKRLGQEVKKKEEGVEVPPTTTEEANSDRPRLLAGLEEAANANPTSTSDVVQVSSTKTPPKEKSKETSTTAAEAGILSNIKAVFNSFASSSKTKVSAGGAREDDDDADSMLDAGVEIEPNVTEIPETPPQEPVKEVEGEDERTGDAEDVSMKLDQKRKKSPVVLVVDSQN